MEKLCPEVETLVSAGFCVVFGAVFGVAFGVGATWGVDMGWKTGLSCLSPECVSEFSVGPSPEGKASASP